SSPLHHVPCLYFFFLLPPLPTSTLFPYTTLFRSRFLWKTGMQGCAQASASSAVPWGARCANRAPMTSACVRSLRRQESQMESLLDRKSTRLNSSHVKISYAVFCLKKKIQKKRPQS